MLNKFRNIIAEDYPEDSQTLFLVAVSGGPDSMALLDLLRRCDRSINVLHCHFGLRKEAHLDTQLVINYCQRYDIPLSVEYFPGPHSGPDESIQMACRQWRYEWFEECLDQHSGAVLVTAHHRDDNVETLFLNLSRGRGINGLSGIPRKKDRRYRPLLDIGKDDIMKYLEDQDLEYAEDSSNRQTDYDRNFIRHMILPPLEERFSQFSSMASQSMDHLAEVRAFLDKHLGEYLSQYAENRDPFTLIRHTEKWPRILIKQYLITLGFNRSSINDLLGSLLTPGKLFSSDTHEVVTTMQGLTVARILKDQTVQVGIPRPGRYPVGLINMVISQVTPPGDITDDPAQILVSADALTFPLTVRTWKNGDKMRPLGMSGSKKVQDLLTDEKIDQLRKRRALVLENGDGRIVWLVGIRMSEEFKLQGDDQGILRIAVDRLPF